jgi:hypothetical protein
MRLHDKKHRVAGHPHRLRSIRWSSPLVYSTLILTLPNGAPSGSTLAQTKSKLAHKQNRHGATKLATGSDDCRRDLKTREKNLVRKSRRRHLALTYPTSTDISIGYPIDVSADPVGYPSWMSYGCLQDILMSSPMDVKRVYP